MEVVIGCYDGNVYAWEHNGVSFNREAGGILFTTGDGIRSTAALADLNGDTLPEIIIGSDDNKIHIVDPTTLSSRVDRFDRTSQLDSRFATKAENWGQRLTQTPHVIFSLDGASSGLSVIPQPLGDIYASPAVGDLDDGGQLDIMVGSEDTYFYAFDMSGSLPGWPVKTQGKLRCSAGLGDLDGDSSLDVLVGGYDYKIYGWKSTGVALDGFPANSGGTLISSPALADVNGDDNLEVFIGSSDGFLHGLLSAGSDISGWPIEATKLNILKIH